MGATSQRYLKLGLIGHPVAHSISPLLHGAALSFAGIAGEYNLIDVPPAELGDMVAHMVRDSYAGWNVTVPHKQAMYQLADELTEEAKKVGAVNTVRIEGTADGAKLIGTNTDLPGFMMAIKRLIANEKAERALIIGAGGAARAAVWGLLQLGINDIIIAARDTTKANELRVNDNVQVCPLDQAQRYAVDLVVNSTPIGQKSPADIPHSVADIFRSHRGIFYDMVYGGLDSRETPLVKLAAENGWRAADGLEMLIGQALLAFEFWSGVKVPENVMTSAFQEQVAKQ